jgi:hypothetical protein
MSWARLLKRVFDIDIDHCPNRGGALKIIACPEPRRRAAIEDPPLIVRILTHLGLPTRAASRAGAPRFDLFQTTRGAENRLPTLAEATLGFSSTRKTIDNSPGWR